jgi:hypothetical protein
MSSDPGGSVQVRETPAVGATILTMSGVLDSSTYLTVRDRIVKAGIDQPNTIIVDITDLRAYADSALAVFTSARWHLTVWPEVPMVLVCGHPSGRRALSRNGIERYVAVYGSLDAALSATRTPAMTPRRRVRTELPAQAASTAIARAFLTEWLTAWSHPSLIPVGAVVVTVLVENALCHSDGNPALRIETDGRAITIAVEDGNNNLPARREAVDAGAALTGLDMIAAVARVWGAAPLPNGKVVWAVIGPENRI